MLLQYGRKPPREASTWSRPIRGDLIAAPNAHRLLSGDCRGHTPLPGAEGLPAGAPNRASRTSPAEEISARLATGADRRGCRGGSDHLDESRDRETHAAAPRPPRRFALQLHRHQRGRSLADPRAALARKFEIISTAPSAAARFHRRDGSRRRTRDCRHPRAPRLATRRDSSGRFE